MRLPPAHLKRPTREPLLRLLRLGVTALLFAWVSGATPPPASAARAALHPSACGAQISSSRLTEPPNVEVWKLPTNANGDHELILTVHNDRDRFCYGYVVNGVAQIGAPTIRVRQGEHFALRLVNDIVRPSKGEMVASNALAPCMPATMSMRMAPVNHYVGYLNHTIDDRYMKVKPVDTNIHLHGFEGPADQENVFLSTLSTPMHACEYHITIPATQPPGTYFYHPHVHGGSDVQMAGGLTGAWIVEPASAEIDPSAEHVIVIRYRLPFANDNPFAPDPTPIFLLGATHEAALKPAPLVAYNPFDPPAWPLSSPIRGAGFTFDPSGCDGISSETVVSLNGAQVPASLDVPGGQVQLLRILNATSDSPKKIELRDATGVTLPLRIVELDGTPISGDIDHPLANYREMDSLMLAPASRVSLLVTVPEGQTLTLAGAHYCEGDGDSFQRDLDLLHIRGVASSKTSSPVAYIPTPAAMDEAPAAKLIAYAQAHPTSIRRRAITFTEYLFPKRGKVPVHSAYYITDTTDPNFHEHPFSPAFAPGGSAPSNPDIVVKQGSIEEWYLFNTTMETHVFHMHQMAFVVESGLRGTPFTSDTVFVPVGKFLPNPHDPDYPLVKPALVKTLLDFRHVPRGTFVFHCHMIFHEDHGMMAIIKVV